MYSSASYVAISKLDAAKRQLELAIKLFLSRSDIVGTHTIAGAANVILKDIAKKSGLKSIMDEVLNSVKPVERLKYRRFFAKAQNFFKHAENDTDKILYFFSDVTEYLLWDSCELHMRITREIPSIAVVYRMWFYSKHPTLLTNLVSKQIAKDFSNKVSYEDRDFFLSMLPRIERKKN